MWKVLNIMRNKTIEFFEKEKVVESYLSGESIVKIASRLKCATRSISAFLNSKDVKLRPNGTVLDKKTVEGLYKEGKTCKEIAKMFNTDYHRISKIIKDLGGTVYHNGFMYQIDSSVFSSIDSEDKAYWLGFMFADGYLDKDRSRFGLNLSIRDKEHMEKFRKFLNYPKEIRYSKGKFPLCRIAATNKQIYNDLISYGCVPNKSLILEFPDESIFRDQSLIRHFIRGYVDGDGCITYADRLHRCAGFSVVGTESMLNGILNHLPCGMQKIHTHHPEADYRNKIFILTDRKAWECIDYLYKDATIYLDRKYQRYKHFMEFYKRN